MHNLSLCHWSRQLFDLRPPSSTDVPVLLLNQPNLIIHAAALNKPEMPVGPLLNPTKTNLLKHQQSGVPHKDLTNHSWPLEAEEFQRLCWDALNICYLHGGMERRSRYLTLP